MVQMVSYYSIPSGLNAGFAVVFGDWPVRVLKHRGWTSERWVCTRVATAEEHEWLSKCNRYQAFRYESLDGLLEDEANFVDEAQLSRISHALTSWSSFKGRR